MSAVAPERAGLGGAATRGAAVTLIGQALRITLQLAGIAVLGRLLDSSAYGLLAMVVAITGVGEVIRDFGLSSAAIQAKTLDPTQKTNLFWLNVAIGGGLTVVVIAASGPIAHLYGDQRLQLVTVFLSLTFLLNGAASQFRADLTRTMRFTAVTVVDIAGQLAGVVLGVLSAVSGAGYWALVVQQLSSALVSLLLAVVLARWRPGLPRRDASVRQFLSFGSNLAAVQLLGYASRNVDSITIGATVGAAALGLYNRAFQLMLLPLNQINAPSTRVALPVLARLQEQRERFAEFLLVGQTALLNVASAVLALCTAQAGAIIAIALGARWGGAVPLFQILSVAGFFSAAGYATYWVFLAKGLTGANLRMSLLTRPVMIAMIVLGSRWGVSGVAAAYSLANVLVWPVQLLWLRRVSDAPVSAMFRNGLRTLVVFGLATALSFLSTTAIPDTLPLVQILVGGLVVLAALALTAAVHPPYRRDVRNLAVIRHKLRRPTAGTRSAL